MLCRLLGTGTVEQYVFCVLKESTQVMFCCFRYDERYERRGRDDRYDREYRKDDRGRHDERRAEEDRRYDDRYRDRPRYESRVC